MTSQAFFEALQAMTNEELEAMMEYTAENYKETDGQWAIYNSCQDILDSRAGTIQ